MTPRATAAGALAVAAGLAAGPAAAHGGLPGGEGFLPGLLHPFVAIEHLLLLLALGLLAGQGPPARRGAGFAAVGLGLLAGLAGTRGGLSEPSVVAPTILGLGCVAGCLLALAPGRPPRLLLPLLAAAAGLAVGLDTDAAPAGVPWAVVAGAVAGVLVGAYLIVLDAAALAVAAARPPFAIAVRVAGSWIAAIALMLLALSVSSTGRAG